MKCAMPARLDVVFYLQIRRGVKGQVKEKSTVLFNLNKRDTTVL